MSMSGPLLVSMAEAIRGLRSFMLRRSPSTSTPASFPNSAASHLNSTSEAGTKLTHSRMLSLVPFGKLGAFCAATTSGIPPTAAAPVAAPTVLRNARRSSLTTPPGCFAMAHSRRTDRLPPRGPRRLPRGLHILARAVRNGGDDSTTLRWCQALFARPFRLLLRRPNLAELFGGIPLTRLGFGSSLTRGRIPAGHSTGLEDSNDEKPEQPNGGDGLGNGRMRDDAGGHPRADADSRRRLDAARQGAAPGASAEARSRPDLDEEQRQAGDGRHREGGFTAAQSYRGEHRARQAPGRAKPPDPARWSTRRSPEAGRCAQGCDEVATLRWRRLLRLAMRSGRCSTRCRACGWSVSQRAGCAADARGRDQAPRRVRGIEER